VRLVLLGDPVGHSRSPAIHRAALAAAGIEGRYEARRVDEAGVYRACAEVRAGDLAGANVTMPHKRAAADRLAPEAARCGAVNTLVPTGGEAVGHNTDVGGLRLARDWAGIPAEGPVLVLGAGGAAAAALLAFAGLPLAISARRAGAAGALAAAVGVEAREVPWGVPVPGAVVVNATPLGMGGEPLPPGVVEEAAGGLIDLPYGAGSTPAAAEARGLGWPTADGLEVLVAQAALAFRLWTGREAPLDVMRRAARTGA